MISFLNGDFPSRICCLFKKTLFSEKLLWHNSSFLEQLFLQSSCYFWGTLFSKQSLLRSSYLFQNIYFFREKLLPSKHFLRIGSYLGKLIFVTANFLVEELFRIKISTEELVFWNRYFCTASTFSEELQYSIPYYQLLLESCLFRRAAFSKEATFYSNYFFRKAIFLQHTFTESYYFIATFPIYELVIRSTFTWGPKWTQTGLKSQTALKCRSVYLAIYIEISLRHLSKQ